MQAASTWISAIDQGVSWVNRIKAKDIIEAKNIYSKLDVDDFYDWAAQHFGLDDYFEDAEDLVAHIKCIFRRDEILMNANADYQFIVKMIGRSEQIFYSQTV